MKPAVGNESVHTTHTSNTKEFVFEFCVLASSVDWALAVTNSTTGQLICGVTTQKAHSSVTCDAYPDQLYVERAPGSLTVQCGSSDPKCAGSSAVLDGWGVQDRIPTTMTTPMCLCKTTLLTEAARPKNKQKRTYLSLL